MTDLGAHVCTGPGPGARGSCERGRKDRKALCFGHFLLNYLQTRRKPNWPLVGRIWVRGKEMVGKTVNSERARGQTR